MESIIIIIHVVAAVAITGLVLIQQGKGADMGASFGSGASQTLFGSAGSGNALTRSTSIMAAVFFITSMGLAVIARQQADLSIDNSGLIQNLDEITQQAPPPVAASDIPAAIEETVSDIPVVDAVPADDIPVVESEAADTVSEEPAN